MRPAPIPPDEEARLAALQRLEILDTPPEEDYDDIVALAAQLCATRMALVSFVDRDRQWFKARVGLVATETPRDLSFCAHVIRAHPDLLIIEDAREDPRFADHPHVLGPPNIRFYAGVPLETRDGHVLGTLCVLDSQPKALSLEQQEGLRALGREVMTLLRLRRANLRLRDALRERDDALHRAELLGDVLSHDLRNHLSVALMRIELAEHRHADAAEALEGIRKPLDKAEEVIQDALRLRPRLEETRAALPRQPVGLSVYGVLETLEPMAERRGVRLHASVDDNSLAASVLLPRAIENLVSNAIKFSPRGGEVEVRVRPLGDGCRIEVADRGPGVPEGMRDRLFERFRRLGQGGEEGFGLGLAIARRIVEGEGGRVGFEDRPGGGSVFFLELPGPAAAAAPPEGAPAAR